MTALCSRKGARRQQRERAGVWSLYVGLWVVRVNVIVMLSKKTFKLLVRFRVEEEERGVDGGYCCALCVVTATTRPSHSSR